MKNMELPKAFFANGNGGFTLGIDAHKLGALSTYFPFVFKPKPLTAAQRAEKRGRCPSCFKKPWDCRCKKDPEEIA